MLNIPEIALLIAVIIIVFGLHKLDDISRWLARVRLKFDKSISEEAIELAVENGDHGPGEGSQTDSDDYGDS